MTMQRADPLAAIPAQRSQQLRSIGLVCVMGLLWLVVEGLPVLLSPGYSLFQVVWMRYAVHLFFLLVLFAPRIGWRLVSTRQPVLQIGRGLLMLVMPWCFIRALDFMAVHNLLALFWFAPLLVLAFAFVLVQDRAHWWTWLATTVACVGAFFVMQPDAGISSRAGMFFVAGMAASFALYVVLTRVLRHEPVYTNLFYTAVCVFVPLTFLMLSVWKMPTVRDVLVMTGVGLAGLGLLWALDRACENTPVSVFTPYLLLPILALGVGTLGAGALPARLPLAGSVLAVGALLFALFMALRAAPTTGFAAQNETRIGHL